MENTNNNNRVNPVDTSTSMAEVLFQYLRHWKYFVLSLILALVIAVGYVFTVTRQYRPSLSILLNEDKSTKTASSDFIDLESLGFLSTTNNIENEIVVLSSPDLMRKTVETLSLNISYYQKKWLRETEIYKKSPFVITLREPNLFDGVCNFEIQKINNVYQIEGYYELKKERKEFTFQLNKLPYEFVLNELITFNISLSGQEIEDTEKYYIKIQSLAFTTTNFVANLSVVSASQKSSILKLSILTENTEKGIDILNNLIYHYNQENSDLNNEIAYNTAIFINDRLKEISVELGDAETDVVAYKQENKIVDLNTEAQLFVTQTGENEKNLMEAQTQLNILKYIQRFIDNPNNSTKIIPNMGLSDIGLSQIIQEYNNKLLASDQLLKGTGEKNPARIRLVEELDNVVKEIAGSLINVKETYTMTITELQRRANATQSQILSVPKQERGLVEKMREQKIKENLFLFLMQKREETNLSIASTSLKARIVISPQSDLLPVTPKSRMIILAFTILGILIPIIIIYVRSLFKTSIGGREELERMTNVSVVGEIAINDTNKFIVANKEQGAISEMFRSLRNNIKFISPKNSGLTIMSTSTIAAEGKSFISANLSFSFASTGKNILLVGADIRKPKLNKYLDVEESTNKKGLSDYLASDNCDWRDLVINASKDFPNFQLLASGTIPPNPNELLMSSRLKSLIEEAQNIYDVIIIDTAPVGLVSDSYLIDEYVDLTLYVVRQNKTPKSAINFINLQQREQKLKNMYIVMNATELTNGYKYGYGKEYGYKTK